MHFKISSDFMAAMKILYSLLILNLSYIKDNFSQHIKMLVIIHGPICDAFDDNTSDMHTNFKSGN